MQPTLPLLQHGTRILGSMNLDKPLAQGDITHMEINTTTAAPCAGVQTRI